MKGKGRTCPLYPEEMGAFMAERTGLCTEAAGRLGLGKK
jgi:hypothetical protein